jgi:RNA polymerase sigma-70 factor (sigma-E family)
MAAWGADARYTRMVEQHGRSLMHLAVLLTGNHADAEDAVQDALISVASSWNPALPLAYLRKAVANKSMDVIRKRRDIPTDEIPDAATEERGFLRQQEDESFFELVRSLPEGQREILVLRYYADLDDRTIASVVGISAETVRSQAHRGLAKLRQLDLVTSKEDGR